MFSALQDLLAVPRKKWTGAMVVAAREEATRLFEGFAQWAVSLHEEGEWPFRGAVVGYMDVVVEALAELWLKHRRRFKRTMETVILPRFVVPYHSATTAAWEVLKQLPPEDFEWVYDQFEEGPGRIWRRGTALRFRYLFEATVPPTIKLPVP